MGGCLSIEDGKNTGSTGNGSNGDGTFHLIQRRGKKKNVIDNSTFDDTIINRKNDDRPNESPSVPILLPDNANFTCSANGRNGWLVHEVYDFGDTVRIDCEECLVTSDESSCY